MDLPSLRKTILRTVRGERSQDFVNQRLGYTFNQMSRWEKGQRALAWQNFVLLCEACEFDLAKALHEGLGFPVDLRAPEALFARLIGDRTRIAAAEAMGVSRHVLGRWLARGTEPHLDDVLKAIQCFSDRLPFVLKAFSSGPAGFARPELEALPACLNLRSQEGLAQVLRIPAAEFAAIVKHLLAQGIVKRVGERLVLADPDGLRAQAIPPWREVVAHWLERGRDRWKSHAAAPSREICGMQSFPVTPALLQAIAARLRRFEDDVRRLAIEHCSEADSVYAVNVHYTVMRGEDGNGSASAEG